MTPRSHSHRCRPRGRHRRFGGVRVRGGASAPARQEREDRAKSVPANARRGVAEPTRGVRDLRAPCGDSQLPIASGAASSADIGRGRGRKSSRSFCANRLMRCQIDPPVVGASIGDGAASAGIGRARRARRMPLPHRPPANRGAREVAFFMCFARATRIGSHAAARTARALRAGIASPRAGAVASARKKKSFGIVDMPKNRD